VEGKLRRLSSRKQGSEKNTRASRQRLRPSARRRKMKALSTRDIELPRCDSDDLLSVSYHSPDNSEILCEVVFQIITPDEGSLRIENFTSAQVARSSDEYLKVGQLVHLAGAGHRAGWWYKRDDVVLNCVKCGYGLIIFSHQENESLGSMWQIEPTGWGCYVTQPLICRGFVLE
jgi:hypothetical protein